MSTIVTVDQIPQAPYYVLSDDPLMSKWGQSNGKVNVCVIPCNNLHEAKCVLAYVKNRGDQENPRITKTIQHYSNRTYSLLTSWRRFAGIAD